MCKFRIDKDVELEVSASSIEAVNEDVLKKFTWTAPASTTAKQIEASLNLFERMVPIARQRLQEFHQSKLKEGM